jgi:hypothetical protein
MLVPDATWAAVVPEHEAHCQVTDASTGFLLMAHGFMQSEHDKTAQGSIPIPCPCLTAWKVLTRRPCHWHQCAREVHDAVDTWPDTSSQDCLSGLQQTRPF